MVRDQDERLHTYLEHGGEPDDEAPVHLHLLLLVAVHHSGGHDLVKPPGGVADDGGDVADEVEQGVEEHQAPKQTQDVTRSSAKTVAKPFKPKYRVVFFNWSARFSVPK